MMAGHKKYWVTAIGEIDAIDDSRLRRNFALLPARRSVFIQGPRREINSRHLPT